MTLDEMRKLPGCAWLKERDLVDDPKRGKGLLLGTVKDLRARVARGEFLRPFMLTSHLRGWQAATVIAWAEANPHELRRQPRPIMHIPTSLYRHFDREDRLLYVGVSMSFLHRQVAHRRTKAWFDQIAKITVEHFPSRTEALAAERKAIKSEGPMYNRDHFSLECANKARLAKKLGN